MSLVKPLIDCVTTVTLILALESLMIFLMLVPLLPMTAPTAVSGIYKNAVSISSCGGPIISGP